MKVLVIYYSQSGQLKSILDSICNPLINEPYIQVDYYAIKPINPHPFPWQSKSFFNVFPETVLEIPEDIEPCPPEILKKSYDLIILGYPIWYLSIALPILSFLKSDATKMLLKNKKVITVIGCRNMWTQAQDKLISHLKQIGADWIGNIVLKDRHSNLISVVTIVDWMFSGIKRRKYGLLPLPGVSQNDIKNCSKFGERILIHLKNNTWRNLQSDLLKLGAVETNFSLAKIESTASKIFNKWATIIHKTPSKRHLLLKIFKIYLQIVIFLLSPIFNFFYYLCGLVNPSYTKKTIKKYNGIY